MTSGDVVVIVLVVVVAMLAGAVVTVLVSLRVALRDLRGAVDALRSDTLPLVDELRDAVTTTTFHVDRVDRLITSAESIEGHVDAASRLAYRTLANPVVKSMAFGSGVKRGAQRLIRRREAS